MQVNNVYSNNYSNQPIFGAYFSNKNAIHLKRLCNMEFDKLSKYDLKEELDWFTKKLPNHELEITQFENLSGLEVNYGDIPCVGRHTVRYNRVIRKITEHKGKYTITNKNTGNSANIWADNIFQFLDGIKKESETLFDKTKNSLTENLNEFSSEIITKLTTKQ